MRMSVLLKIVVGTEDLNLVESPAWALPMGAER